MYKTGDTRITSQQAYESFLIQYQRYKKTMISLSIIRHIFQASYSGEVVFSALHYQQCFTIVRNAPSFVEIFRQVMSQTVPSPNKTTYSIQETKHFAQFKHSEDYISPAKTTNVARSYISDENIVPTINIDILIKHFLMQIGAKIDAILEGINNLAINLGKLNLQFVSSDSELGEKVNSLIDEISKLQTEKEQLFVNAENMSVIIEVGEQICVDIAIFCQLLTGDNDLSLVEITSTLAFWSLIISSYFSHFSALVWKGDANSLRLDRWWDTYQQLNILHWKHTFRLADDPYITLDELISRSNNLLTLYMASSSDRMLGAAVSNDSNHYEYLCQFFKDVRYCCAGLMVANVEFSDTEVCKIDDESFGTQKARRVSAPQSETFSDKDQATLFLLGELAYSLMLAHLMKTPTLVENGAWKINQLQTQYEKFTSQATSYLSEISTLENRIDTYVQSSDHHHYVVDAVKSVMDIFSDIKKRCHHILQESDRRRQRIVQDILKKASAHIVDFNKNKESYKKDVGDFCKRSLKMLGDQSMCIEEPLSMMVRTKELLDTLGIILSTYKNRADIPDLISTSFSDLLCVQSELAAILFSTYKYWYISRVLMLGKDAQEIDDVKGKMAFVRDLKLRKGIVMDQLEQQAQNVNETFQKLYLELRNKISVLDLSDAYCKSLVHSSIPILLQHQSELETGVYSLPSLLFLVKQYLKQSNKHDNSELITKVGKANNDSMRLKILFDEACNIFTVLDSLPRTDQDEDEMLANLKEFFERYKEHCSTLVDQYAMLSMFAQEKKPIASSQEKKILMINTVDTLDTLLSESISLYQKFNEAVMESVDTPNKKYYEVLSEIKLFLKNASQVDPLEERIASFDEKLRPIISKGLEFLVYYRDLLKSVTEQTNVVFLNDNKTCV